ERDPARVDRLAAVEGITLGDRPRRAAEAADDLAQLALDDQLREILVGQPFGRWPPGVRRGRERGQNVVVEEVGERSMPDGVPEARAPERLHDEPLGRDWLGVRAPRDESRSERRIQR